VSQSSFWEKYGHHTSLTYIWPSTSQTYTHPHCEHPHGCNLGAVWKQYYLFVKQKPVRDLLPVSFKLKELPFTISERLRRKGMSRCAAHRHTQACATGDRCRSVKTWTCLVNLSKPEICWQVSWHFIMMVPKLIVY